MKRIIFLFFLLTSAFTYGQILEPAEWDIYVSEDNPKTGSTIEIVFDVAIDQNWYLYSNDFDPDLGPMVTEFFFTPHESYELVGEVNPIDPKRKYDSLFEGYYTYFRGTAKFIQKVKILEPEYLIAGSSEYQVCSDIDGKCILFEEEFSLRGEKKKEEAKVSPAQSESNIQKPEIIKSEDIEDKVVGSEEEKASAVPADTSKNLIESVQEPVDIGTAEDEKKGSLLLQKGNNDPYSLLSFMLVAFFAGLAALLTPCVFPMIPMTVTFFTGKNHHKKGRFVNSLFYGVSIIAIYSIIGVIVAPFMGPETANDLATGWIPNVIFFTVFVLFALSFFGLFEITIPHKWVNRADAMGDKGGFIGIFFMALTLVLVSFSCTGPIVGSILVESAGGLALKPVLGMLAFSAAFAIPFTLFAFFPGWLNSLPKSGGWLNSVKIVLGFLELALAFKFLSIADQAYHWRILDREVYLAIWIVIFTLLGFYLLGKIKLPGDSDSKILSVPRLILAMITFTFVIYLIPGMFGAPLKALAGYLPPLTTHDFNIVEVVRDGGGVAATPRNEQCAEPLYDDFLEWPHGLQGYFDYDQAVACAKASNKPIFVDFTGHGCVNCREMEQRVWPEPEVLTRLQENFVLLALYVDDKTTLPEEEWYVSDYDGKVKKTIGKQNADFQITRFNNNAQPFYVILSPDGELLAKPRAYDLNISKFVTFLDKGVEMFNSRAKNLNQ